VGAFVIAVNTFREGVRAKVLYNLVFFAVLMICFSYFVGQLTLGENLKVMIDMGLFSISIFGILISIFVGIGIIYKEIEKRTIYTILSKPIKRSQFIVGKYFGLCSILFVQLVLMWVLFSLVLYLYSGGWQTHLLIAGYTIFLELMVITAVAIFFSSFSSPFLSALFTMSFYLIGHTTTELLQFGTKTGNFAIISVLTVVNKFNLDHFNLMTEVVHGLPITAARIIHTTAYGISMVVLILIVSALIFDRRDFK
jgi:ABC-type transport system involved in multi-copper enzyme maturation permease subunit